MTIFYYVVQNHRTLITQYSSIFVLRLFRRKNQRKSFAFSSLLLHKEEKRIRFVESSGSDIVCFFFCVVIICFFTPRKSFVCIKANPDIFVTQFKFVIMILNNSEASCRPKQSISSYEGFVQPFFVRNYPLFKVHWCWVKGCTVTYVFFDASEMVHLTNVLKLV